VTDTYDKALEANTWARRVGVDRIVGCLDGGLFAWATHGLKTEDVRQVSAENLHTMISGKSGITLLDVRAPQEFVDSHIEGAINIPAPDLRRRYKELNPDLPTVLICSTGHRSSLGASILKQNGFHEVYNTAGGMTGYHAAGFVKKCGVCSIPHASRYYDHDILMRSGWGFNK
jgi:rhodanese-related sulfurtransferase